MIDTDAIDRRIDRLEARIMHQDQTIDELNTAITEQWRHIDSLTRRIQQIDERLRDFASTPPAGQEQPPPHY